MSSGAETSGAEVRVTVPGGFGPGDLAAPDFSQSPRLAVEQWRSARDPGGHLALAWACVRGDASAWSADATELAQGKLAELASGTAARMRGTATPMHVVAIADGGRSRTLVADGANATVHARARTFVAFTADRAHACFVVCTSAADGCDAAVDRARVDGALVPPPAPGVALRTLAMAVHHPRGALAVVGCVLVVAAALAIATRPGRTRRRHPRK